MPVKSSDIIYNSLTLEHIVFNAEALLGYYFGKIQIKIVHKAKRFTYVVRPTPTGTL